MPKYQLKIYRLSRSELLTNIWWNKPNEWFNRFQKKSKIITWKKI